MKRKKYITPEVTFEVMETEGICDFTGSAHGQGGQGGWGGGKQTKASIVAALEAYMDDLDAQVEAEESDNSIFSDEWI